MAGRLLNFLGRRREEKLSKPRIARKALILCHCLFILIKPSGIFQSTTFPTITSTFTTSTTFDWSQKTVCALDKLVNMFLLRTWFISYVFEFQLRYPRHVLVLK